MNIYIKMDRAREREGVQIRISGNRQKGEEIKKIVSTLPNSPGCANEKLVFP